MPLYEYECEACGHRFERIQRFSDALVDECPKCGAKKVHKLVSSPAIQFKGSGWYITDYAKKGMTAADGSKVGEGKGSEDKGDKAEKGDRAEKGDKADKAEKSEKSAAKDDKPAAKVDKSSSGSSTSSGSSDSSASPGTPSTKS
jgi:putative FmdB family regulatory protein